MIPLRIAFAYESAYPWFNGGVEKRRYNILKRLTQNPGNEIHMFTLYRPGMPGKEFVYENVAYHCVGKASDINKMYVGGNRRSILFSVKFSFLVFLALLKYKFDIIDTDSFPFVHIPLIYLYSKIRHVKFVVTWHEVWNRQFWAEYLPGLGKAGYALESFTAKVPNAHIANSELTKQLLTKYFGIASSKIAVFPAAVDMSEINDFLAKNSKNCKKEDKFLVVGRLVKHKRVDLAISAFKNVNAKLVVVGKGPELHNLKRLAERLGINKKIEFKQDLSIDALYKEYCTSRGLILTSEREGLSLVAVEALSLGVPVFIVRSTSLPNEVRMLCNEAEDSKLDVLLNDALKNYEKYGAKAAKVRETALRRFSNQNAERVYASLYSKI